ncbi:hypothetical protein HMPREF0653_01994 [Prevotella disiens JCM 6334 = ATCC 29426]|jgi:hypothetical protein|uniref:Uncharacterized protein n=3 Tax=Prevotella disiens TaxID=28130 RepID=E1KN73_9BACT|nr:hypothetical protein HMPREF9296_2175 [Prevotella disiens FB035-09AN]ERJ75279.1 hypothetical protein HMPREF0653_01994 [Prevotella disiens JCM 6334 = ATCC 29426]SUB86245.1 Uncharacterised protein [Prevotella disiens]
MKPYAQRFIFVKFGAIVALKFSFFFAKIFERKYRPKSKPIVLE